MTYPWQVWAVFYGVAICGAVAAGVVFGSGRLRYVLALMAWDAIALVLIWGQR